MKQETVRKFVVTVFACFAITGVFGQGLVILNNNPQTLVSVFAGGPPISGPTGSFFFGLLTSATGTAGSFTFQNLYATNSGVAVGRFIGGTVSVPGWAAGTTKFYEIAGWGSSLGTTFNPIWLTVTPGPSFGISVLGSGVAGGTTAGGQSFPTLPLFGGTGITSGFTLNTLIPEPSGMALGGLGVGALLIFRRRR